MPDPNHTPDEGFPNLEPLMPTTHSEEAFIGNAPADHAGNAVREYIERQIIAHGRQDTFITELISKWEFLTKAIELVSKRDEVNKELRQRGRDDLVINSGVKTPALKSPEVFDTQLDESRNEGGETNNIALKFVLLKKEDNSDSIRAYTKEEFIAALTRELSKGETKTHLAKKAMQRAGTLFPDELSEFIEKISNRALECRFDKEHKPLDFVQEYAEEFFIWHEILRHLIDDSDEGVMIVNRAYLR
jgi:hypothetical protein